MTERDRQFEDYMSRNWLGWAEWFNKEQIAMRRDMWNAAWEASRLAFGKEKK